MDFECAIIGGGPGGLVSALYLRRFLRSVVVASGGAPRASWIPKTHNLVGYRGGISGVELLSRLQQQLDELGVERAVGLFKISKIRGGFRVTSNEDQFTAKKVIIATGITDHEPELGNVPALRRLGLLRYCPVCDAYEYQNKRIAVMARDEHGLMSSLFLSKFTKKLQVIWSPSARIPRELARRCEGKGLVIHHSNVEAMSAQKGAEPGLMITLEGQTKNLFVDACYVALGTTVNDGAFRDLKGLKRTDEGYLVTGPHQELSVPGLFAVGDCVEGLAQIGVAAGQAAVAATTIHRELG